MKAFPTLAAVAIAIALVATPMVANAAGSISFSSPASGASYKGSESYTIAGTVTPVPTQADNVAIKVTGPSGLVDAASVPVSLTTGAFSYPTAVGNPVNPSSWPTGTYTITATDSYGVTASTTFAYASSTSPQFNETRALVNIQGNITLIENELKTAQTDNKANFTAITTQLTSLSQQVTTLSNTVSGMSTTITQMSSTISGLNSAIQSAQAAATAAETAANQANSSVSSTQTYVLVVAVLAAITLVLELAILVRKLS